MSSDEILISSASGAESFIVSLVTNLVLGIGAILGISLLRRNFLAYFFDPRRSDAIRNCGYHRGAQYLERPPRQSTTTFGWILDVLSVPENVYMRSAGLDAVVALRFFLRMGVFLTVYAIATFIVIVPVQASSANNNNTNGFNALSILSLEAGSSKLWANLIFTYLFTGILLKVLHSTWFEMIELKQRWIANGQLLGQRLTVLVSRIPKQYATSASLCSLFEEIYPGQVAGAYVVQTNPRLNELYAQREEAVHKINSAKGEIELSEAAWDRALSKSGQLSSADITNVDNIAAPEVSVHHEFPQAGRPKMSLSMCGEKNVDVIDYYTERLSGLDREIAVILNKISEHQSTAPSEYTTNMVHLDVAKKLDNDNDNDDDDDEDEETKKLFDHSISTPHVGFVTFRSAVTAASVLSSTISESIRVFNVKLAPEPKDISWFGINSSPRYRLMMSSFLSCIVFLLIVFYTIPITIISALMTVESLSEIFPFLEPVLTFSPVIQGIISGLLPSLAMIIFMALLPKILYAFGYLSGLDSHTEIAIYVFKRYFLFQFINFFLVACVSSTVFNELQAIIDNPAKIPSLLASGLPQSGLLFINYIMMRAFFTNLFAIIDIPDILLNKLSYCLSKTPDEAVSALSPSPELYHKNLPEAVLIFIIAYTFGTIQPMMLVFAALYFFTMYFAKRYSLLFISVNAFQTGGGFWPLLFDRILLGMVTGQLCLLGLLGLKEQIAPAILMIPLIIFTIWFWVRYSNLYDAKAHRLTMISARVTDSAIDALSPQQHQALIEGFDLPSGPAYLSMLPFLIPEMMGDTHARESNLTKLGLHDESFQPDLSLYESLIPTNVTAYSEVQRQSIAVSRDFISLPEQFHGDDVAMDRNYKQWLYEHDLVTNPPLDVLINGFLPRSITKKRQAKQKLVAENTLNAAAGSLSVSRDSGCDVESDKKDTAGSNKAQNLDDEENLFVDQVKLTLEQHILLEQLIFRWKRSQQLIARPSFTQPPELSNPLNQSQNDVVTAGGLSVGDIEQGPGTEIAQSSSRNAAESLASLPLGSISELPSVDTQTPFKKAQIDSSMASGVRRGTIQRQNTLHTLHTLSSSSSSSSSSSVLVPNNQTSTVAVQFDVLVDDQLPPQQPKQQLPQQGRMVMGLGQKNLIPSSDEMEQVMMRYFTPETNPRSYSRVAKRVWGTTYVTYRAFKGRQEQQKKEQKK